MIGLSLAGCNQDTQMERATPMATPTTFNRFAKVPERPPEVRLVRDDAADPVVGVLNVVNWQVAGGPAVPAQQKPWQMTTPVPRTGATTFEFDTSIPPGWSSVDVFVALSDETGSPVDPETGDPTLFGPIYLECVPDADGCMERNGETVRWDVLPKDMYEEEFVTVWAQWLLIPENQDERPGTVSATWVFHFINE